MNESFNDQTKVFFDNCKKASQTCLYEGHPNIPVQIKNLMIKLKITCFCHCKLTALTFLREAILISRY